MPLNVDTAACRGQAAFHRHGCLSSGKTGVFAPLGRGGDVIEIVGKAPLRRAIEIDDGLPYDEPWGWMQPTRHAYGALLLEQGRVAEAETVYRADLGFDDTLPRACQHPGNVWSLHGFHECLVRLGQLGEAAIIEQQLKLTAALADVPIESSCFCRLER